MSLDDIPTATLSRIERSFRIGRWLALPYSSVLGATALTLVSVEPYLALGSAFVSGYIFTDSGRLARHARRLRSVLSDRHV